jgi:uncharacterized cupredoxin-like copper-binding protein
MSLGVVIGQHRLVLTNQVVSCHIWVRYRIKGFKMQGGWRTAIAAMLVMAASVGVSCAGDDEVEPPGLEHDVHVHLEEWSVRPQPASVPGPAAVAFGGHNHGKYPHQVTLVKTDMPVDDLPLVKSRVDAEAAGELIMEFEVPEADGGEGRQVGVANLTVGKYAILCNIPGHYLQGMFASFEVTEAPTGTP